MFPRRRVGQEQQIDLPISIEQLNGSWTVTEVSKPNSDKWSFMWDAFVDDGREKRLMREPFVHETFLEAGNLDDTSEGDLVIQAIMKVFVATLLTLVAKTWVGCLRDTPRSI